MSPIGNELGDVASYDLLITEKCIYYVFYRQRPFSFAHVFFRVIQQLVVIASDVLYYIT